MGYPKRMGEASPLLTGDRKRRSSMCLRYEKSSGCDQSPSNAVETGYLFLLRPVYFACTTEPFKKRLAAFISGLFDFAPSATVTSC